MDCIPVTLVMGPTGSGKTTLLNQLVRQHADSVPLVIQNDFGRTQLDHPLVVAIRPGSSVEGACICCARSQDLFTTLKQAPWRFSRGGKRLFSRVFIEAPGEADPQPLLQALQGDRLLAERYVAAGVVTVVDARLGAMLLRTHPQAVLQARRADCIVIARPEQAGAADREALAQRLSELNTVAPRVCAAHGLVDSAQLAGLAIFAPMGPAGNLHD